MEIEQLEAEATKKISVAASVLVERALEATNKKPGHPALALEEFAKRFALELVDQVEYETVHVPGSDYHMAVACSLVDFGSAWLRANDNL